MEKESAMNVREKKGVLNLVNIPVIPVINHKAKYEPVARAIGQLVDEKNKAYGDAFNKSGDFLKLLYPDGIKPEQYGDMLALVRVFDKQMRIATAKEALD